jgi:hypothetical protein
VQKHNRTAPLRTLVFLRLFDVALEDGDRGTKGISLRCVPNRQNQYLIPRDFLEERIAIGRDNVQQGRNLGAEIDVVCIGKVGHRCVETSTISSLPEAVKCCGGLTLGASQSGTHDRREQVHPASGCGSAHLPF